MLSTERKQHLLRTNIILVALVKLRLNQGWCHMDYFTDFLATFLYVDRDSILVFYGWPESSQI